MGKESHGLLRTAVSFLDYDILLCGAAYILHLHLCVPLIGILYFESGMAWPIYAYYVWQFEIILRQYAALAPVSIIVLSIASGKAQADPLRRILRGFIPLIWIFETLALCLPLHLIPDAAPLR